MLEAPVQRELQTLSWNIGRATHKLATEAEPIRSLSTRDGKSVDVIEDANGNKAVKRTYGRDALATLNLGRNSFTTEWGKMNRTFSQAGVDIVPSFILSDEPGRAVVVSSFLEDARPMKSAPTEQKEKLAEALGRVVSPQSLDFFPHIQMFLPDAFQTTRGEDGQDKIVLTDIDPYASLSGYLLKTTSSLRDAAYGLYIWHMAGMLYDSWLKPEERDVVLGKFVKGIMVAFKEEPHAGDFMKTMQGIQTAQMLRQGVDLRNRSGFPL